MTTLVRSGVRFGVKSVTLGSLLALAAFIACNTDNGDTAHGPDIGPLPIGDGGRKKLPDGAIVEADGAPVTGDDDDAAGHDDSGPVTGTCASGTAAVVAGNDSTLTGAVRVKGGPWSGSAIANGSAKSKPALVAFGAGFLGVSQGGDGSLQTFKYSSSWSAASKIGADGVKGPPTLAVAGTKTHVVYSAGPGANTDYKHGINDGTSWNAATEDVGSNPPSEHSFGTISAGLAPIGNDIAFAENGSDNGLYARTFASTWSTAIPVTGAGSIGTALPATPEIVSVSGKYDVVIIYAYKGTGHALAFATHEPGSATWGNADTQFIAGALTAEKFSAAALSASTIALTFRGDDMNAYYTIGTVGAAGITWTAPVAVGGGTAIAVDAAPAVAKGDCGDDAIFAFASGGAVKSTSLRGTTFTAPAPVTGASGTNVAIATKP